MTGDEYIALLEERRAEYVAAHPPTHPWVAPLLEWFIRPGDELLVTLPPASKQAKRPVTPRTYRPASHWRDLRDKAQQDLDALTRPSAYDPAMVNLSPTARSRAARAAGRRRMDGLDRDTRRVALLLERIDRLDGKARRAEAREARQARHDTKEDA